jgi:RNA polymerase sigma-70 factor (ECF subfamily)
LRDFAGIYEQHVSQVYGFFAYLVSSCDEAEDLTQQTFERALGAYKRHNSSVQSALPWLMVIARNLFIDHLRAARIQTQPLDEAELKSLAAAPDRCRLGLEPEVERALLELGPRERELIALRFGGDLTGAEIAALTGLSLANVQQILSRSLRRMRASMRAQPAERARTAGVA